MSRFTSSLSPSRLLAPSGGNEVDSLGSRNLDRLLLNLRRAGPDGLTIAELLAGGVAAPAQAVYELQIAGYVIDRVHTTAPGGHRKVLYRLRVTESRPA